MSTCFIFSFDEAGECVLMGFWARMSRVFLLCLMRGRGMAELAFRSWEGKQCGVVVLEGDGCWKVCCGRVFFLIIR